jgi:hypothetical protein
MQGTMATTRAVFIGKFELGLRSGNLEHLRLNWLARPSLQSVGAGAGSAPVSAKADQLRLNRIRRISLGLRLKASAGSSYARRYKSRKTGKNSL